MAAFSDASLNSPRSVFVSGNYAYVGNSTSLVIVDVTNPTAPVFKGSIGGVLAESVYISGNYAYVVGGNALSIIDVSNPATPVQVGSLVAGTGGSIHTNAVSIFVSGNYAYIAAQGSNGLEIVNVSNPASPVHAGSITHGAGGAVMSLPSCVQVSGNYAYVTSLSSGSLEIVDVSNPVAPVHKSVITYPFDGVPTNVTGVSIAGNFAYLTSMGRRELNVIDISNPAVPAQRGTYNFEAGAEPYNIAVSGNYAYVTLTNNTLRIIDISNPDQLRYLNAYIADGEQGAQLNNPLRVSVSGAYAYVASSISNALEIVEFIPITITSFAPTSGIRGMTLTITGTNFSTTSEVNKVRFGTAQASLYGANYGTPTSTMIQVKVPAVGTNNGYVLRVSRTDQHQWAQTIDGSGSYFYVYQPYISSPSTGVYGDNINLTSFTGGATGAVSYAVTNGTGTASVSGSTLTLTGVGKVTVTATIAADGIYNAISFTQEVTITKAKLMASPTRVSHTHTQDSCAAMMQASWIRHP